MKSLKNNIVAKISLNHPYNGPVCLYTASSPACVKFDVVATQYVQGIRPFADKIFTVTGSLDYRDWVLSIDNLL